MKSKFPELTKSLVEKLTLFRIPPFSDDIRKAYQLITGQFDLKVGEECRRFLERDQNGACWGEYSLISEYLTSIGMRRPEKVLEIGPGMGRSVVFFKKKFGWEDVSFHIYEGNGEKFTDVVLGPRSPEYFCGNIPILEKILEYNEIRNYEIFNAKELNFRIDNLPGPYDIIYSFYSVGFHWNLEHFIDEISKIMHEKTVCFFVVFETFELFEELEKFRCELLEFPATFPVDVTRKMLVLRKK